MPLLLCYAEKVGGCSGVSAERRHFEFGHSGLPTRRYGQKFEDVVKSTQDAAVLVLVYLRSVPAGSQTREFRIRNLTASSWPECASGEVRCKG